MQSRSQLLLMFFSSANESSMATVLKYRGQVIPSLGSQYFEKYRSNVDQVSSCHALGVVNSLVSSLNQRAKLTCSFVLEVLHEYGQCYLWIAW